MENKILNLLIGAFGGRLADTIDLEKCDFPQLKVFLGIKDGTNLAVTLEKAIQNQPIAEKDYKNLETKTINELEEYKKRNTAYHKFITTIKNYYGEDFHRKKGDIKREIGFSNQLYTALDFNKYKTSADQYDMYSTRVRNYGMTQELNIKNEGLKKKSKWLLTLSILFLLGNIFFFTKIRSTQKEVTTIKHASRKEIKNIKLWYTSQDAVLAETYPFLKDNSTFKNNLDKLKKWSLNNAIQKMDVGNYVFDNTDSTFCENNAGQCFDLFDKQYVQGKFFVMQNGNLVEDNTLSKENVGKIALRLIQGFISEGMLKNKASDKNYLNKVLGINEGNSKIFANLAYIAIQDSISTNANRQIMVRFPAYTDFNQEKMKAYRFEDRPWWPKNVTRDTSYLTQPYGDIRDGLPPVRTYVTSFTRKDKNGKKIRIVMGVDLIYDLVGEEN